MTFSIVTPSFNQLDWLRLCVASVKDQIADGGGMMANENSKFKINNSTSIIPPLAVDHIIQDAGTPGIEDFAREIGADFYRDGNLVFNFSDSQDFSISRYRIAVHCEADAGMYDAINLGLAKSSGEICAWLNSDEQYLEGTLRKVASIFCARKHVDVLLGDALLVDAKLEPVCYRRIILPNKWHTRLAYLHSLSCSMFFKRSILPSPPLSTRWKVISDAILMTYFLESKRNIHACKQLLAAYAFTGVNLSAGPLKAEKDQWWGENLWPPKYSTPFVLFHHRLRRLWSGAYGTHRVQCSLYTFDSCHQREMLADSPIPGTWPQAQA